MPTAGRDKLRKLNGSRLRASVRDPALKLVLPIIDGKQHIFGDVHVAGPPCVDFSSMGLGRGAWTINAMLSGVGARLG